MTHETHQHVKLSLFVHKFGCGCDIQCYSKLNNINGIYKNHDMVGVLAVINLFLVLAQLTTV